MLHDHRDDELTVVSFSTDPPSPPLERRSSPRDISVLRTALLRTSHGEELCLVRNISIGGLMAHVFSDLAVADPVTIEFKSEHSVRGRVVWRRDELAGIKFGQPIELSDVLSNQFESTFMPLAPRAPRAEVNVPARVRSTNGWQPAILRNISQGGAKLQLSKPDEIGATVLLSAPGLAVIPGAVRWRRDGNAGVAFDRLIPFSDIARWVAESHRQRERRYPPPSETSDCAAAIGQ